MTDYSTHLDILRRGSSEDLSNIYIQHGLVHLFLEQLALAQDALRQALRGTESSLYAMGSPKELIAAAYEEFLFMDESLWLSMLRDADAAVRAPIDAKALTARIVTDYLPAFEAMEKALQP